MEATSSPRPADLLLERLVDHYRQAESGDLSWIHGQGSVITGLREDSDLDLIMVWDRQVPTSSTLPVPSKITPLDPLMLEQTRFEGFDVDLMHLPRPVFEAWLDELDHGEGWSGGAWPLPIYAASGLAESKLLLDPSGLGEAHRSRVQVPAPPLIENVRQRLETAITPGFGKELYRAAELGNCWLHANLALQLHKLIYTAWFLFEGHYPPFPKYLPQWYERFGMDRELQELEATYWATADPVDATAVLESLAAAVLALPGRSPIR